MSVKRYQDVTNHFGPDAWTEMRESESGDYVEYTDYAAIAERCERLEAALRKVMRPYGMYDKAVFHTCGPAQDYVLEIGREIQDLLAELAKDSR